MSTSLKTLQAQMLQLKRVHPSLRLPGYLAAALFCCLHAAHAADAGVLDTHFVPMLFNGGEVQVTAPAAGSQLYIGGDFDWVSGQPADWLARVNADGSVDPAFSPTKPGNAGRMLALAVQADGKVLVGYYFQMLFYAMANAAPSGAASSPHSSIIIGPSPPVSFAPTEGIIIRLNADGTVDSTFNTVDLGADWQTDTKSVLQFIQPQADGKILIGGSFVTVDGTSEPNLAQLNADGTLDTTFTTTVNGAATTALRSSDGTTLIGGSFTKINGTKLPFGLARLKANGSRDSKFVPRGKAKATTVTGIATGPAGTILIATVSQQTVKGVVSHKSNLESVSSGGLYHGALATNVTGKAVNIALLGSGQAVLISATGSETQTTPATHPIAPGLAVFCGLTAGANAKLPVPQTVSLPFHPNGLVTTASGLAGFGSSGVAAGASPSGFSPVRRNTDPPVPDFKGWVGKTASVSHVVAAGNELLVSGWFDFGVTSDGTIVDRQGLAKLNADGTVDAAFAPSATYVNLLLADADGGATLIGTTTPASGVIVPTGGVVPPYNTQSLFRLTPTGALDATFTVSAQASATVLVAQSDGGLLVGGWAGLDATPVLTSGSTVPGAGSSVAPLRRYLSTGALDTSFAPVITNSMDTSPLPPGISTGTSATTTTVPASITDVTLDIDGSLLVTGSFTQINGADSPGIARLLAEGSLDTSNLITAVPGGFTHVLPRPGGYLVTAPSLWDKLLPIVMPGAVSGSGAAPAPILVIIGPIGGPGTGSTISPFLGTLPTGVADSSFSVGDLVPADAWSLGGPMYGVKLIVPDAGGGWVAMTRGLKDTTTGNAVSLVRIGTDASVDRSFTAPVFASNPSPFGGMIFWWGISQPADYVDTMIELADGSVIVGGTFWSVNGEARSGLAKLNLGK